MLSRSLLQALWEDTDQTASVLTSATLQYETCKSFQTTHKSQNTVSIFIKAAKALMESCTPEQRWAQPCVGSYQLTGVLWKSKSWRQCWSEVQDWIISLTKIKPWQLVQKEGAFGNTRDKPCSETPIGRSEMTPQLGEGLTWLKTFWSLLAMTQSDYVFWAISST